MESKMNLKTSRTILLVGNDAALRYLLGRFVEQSECALAIVPVITSAQEITEINPKAIIFLSTEHLKAAQTLMTELTSTETPIIVCSAVADEARARELGADRCLLHPITYDGFQKALEGTSAPKDT
jgi:CheY-like chemotaxis protein